MARGADIPDISGELPLRTCGSTASMKVKNVKKLSFTKGHFPKMAECAHFHYENVDFGNIQAEELNIMNIRFPHVIFHFMQIAPSCGTVSMIVDQHKNTTVEHI
uniref:Rho GTPase-activating protein 32 n=1 Tax=Sphaerodactylus townsendi TaxID=933632 RepID=A0ACB8EXZ5_9SAUR